MKKGTEKQKKQIKTNQNKSKQNKTKQTKQETKQHSLNICCTNGFDSLYNTEYSYNNTHAYTYFDFNSEIFKQKLLFIKSQ